MANLLIVTSQPEQRQSLAISLGGRGHRVALLSRQDLAQASRLQVGVDYVLFFADLGDRADIDGLCQALRLPTANGLPMSVSCLPARYFGDAFHLDAESTGARIIYGA